MSQQVRKLASLLLFVLLGAGGCTSNADVKPPEKGGRTLGSGSTLSGSSKSDDLKNSTNVETMQYEGDIDVGGYDDEPPVVSTSTATSTDTGTGAEPQTPPPPPAKGLQESERHGGTITFQNRLQPFTLTVSSFVGGKSVKSAEFKLGDRDKPKITIPGLCVNQGSTCLVVTIAGGITQTAGKTACAKATNKSPTEVFINSDPDGKGLIGTCFDEADDIEDAFTISCPQSQELRLNQCL